MASPGSDDGVVIVSVAAAVVCCMCGDHGLPHELFRCSLCRLRRQHRYCSDLYPRVSGPYRSCNWCLRQGAAAGGDDSPSPVKAAVVAGTKRRMRGDDDDRDNNDDDESACYGCSSRSVFLADPGKPINKPKKGRERAAVQRPEPVVTTTSVPKKRRREEVQPGKPRFKVKVRRYKLLTEVIC